MQTMKIIIFIVVILFFNQYAQNIFAQKSQANTYRDPTQRNQVVQSEKIKSIFNDISKSISSNKIELLSMYIFKQVKISLLGAEIGYFSENQVTSILENYFNSRRVVDFKLPSIKTSDEGPYATGGGHWNIKGKQEKFQVYITIAEQEKRWVITQFKIY